MAPLPSLVPLPPQRTAPASLNTSPFWLGSSREAAYPLFLPGIVERHAVLVERADGYWILPGSGPTTVNGASIGSGVLLRHGDVIRLAPGGEFRFESGEAPAAPPPEAIVESVPVQRSNRRKPRRMAARLPRPFIIAASIAAVLLVVAAVIIVRGLTRTEDKSQLSAEETVMFDSLLAVSYEHVERGTALLEIGARAAALQEFAAGVNTLRASSLRSHPFVTPRIEALEASVAAIWVLLW